MATDPNDIQLALEDRQLLARLAEKMGKPWADALRALVEPYLNETGSSSDLWLKAQEEAVARVWDNDADAEYEAL